MLRPLILLLVMLVVSSTAQTGWADNNELVEACHKSVNSGSYELACQLCQQAVDGTTGSDQTVARLNLARCQEARGELVRALASFHSARAALAADDPRVVALDRRIAELEPQLGTLQLDWSGLPADVTVKLDDEAVPARTAELRVDPGERHVVVMAAGHRDGVTSLTMPRGGTERLHLMAGEARPLLQPQQVAGLAVGGLGVLGLIAFGVTGGLALDRQATFDERCPAPEQGPRQCADAAAIDAANEGDTLNIANLIALGAGVAGLGAGLILFFTAPEETEPVGLRVRVGPNSASFSLEGTL